MDVKNNNNKIYKMKQNYISKYFINYFIILLLYKMKQNYISKYFINYFIILLFYILFYNIYFNNLFQKIYHNLVFINYKYIKRKIKKVTHTMLFHTLNS